MICPRKSSVSMLSGSSTGSGRCVKCYSPHYEIDYQNKMVYCLDCGAIVDRLEALMRIAKDTKRWDDYTQEMLDAAPADYELPARRVVIKKLEKQYVKNDRVKPGADLPQMRTGV